MGVHIEDNMVVIREPKTFYFDFNFAKDVDKISEYNTSFSFKCVNAL